jgi:seryl-tRNA synthetase
MQEAQRARWATIKGKLETPAPVTKEAPKRQISAEGMKRIIAATKKRWRLKRAADKAAQEQAEAKKVASQIARKKAAAPVKAAKTKAAVANAAPATVPAPATLAAAAEQV